MRRGATRERLSYRALDVEQIGSVYQTVMGFTVEVAGGRMLTHATYEALGGLEGAIAARADKTVAGLSPNAQNALPRVLRTLATVSSGADQVAVARDNLR